MVVLDASVLLKWFYPPQDEPHTDIALELRQRLLDGRITVVVPSFAMYECASSMHHSRYRLPPSIVRGRIRDLWGLPLTIDRLSRRMLWRAAEIAAAYGGAVYDGYYFAAAQFRHCPCVTADQKAYRYVKKLPWVHFLGSVRDVSAYDD